MLRALWLLVSVLMLPLAQSFAQAPPALSENAALSYWQAFPQLPKLTDADASKLYSDCLTMPIDAHVKEMLASEQTRYAFRMMHRAAARKQCDWDIAYEEGIGALLPNVGASRTLAGVACLRARLEFEQGKIAEAVDDVLAGLAMARHVSDNGVFIQLVVGYGIEHRMIETLALFIPRLDAQAIKSLKARLDALPSGGNPVSAMAFEVKACPDWLERKLKEAKTPDEALAFISGLMLQQGDSPKKGPEKSRAFLQECGGTAEGVLKCIGEMRHFYAASSLKLGLPVQQFNEEFTAEVKKRAATNPVIRELFPALERVRTAQARIDVRRALLSAALAVQTGGKDALKNHADPVAGGPFDYVALEGGFELRSKARLDNKPLTLVVGKREK
ncbi:MAG: hypothetical protein ACJ8F7_01785 [Gemmataceae bacterium]